MLGELGGHAPKVDATAWVAPNAMVCGDVTIGAGSVVMFGAQIIAEGGAIEIGENCVVLESAVLRSTPRHHLDIGDDCLVGPNAHVVGCAIEPGVFIATGATVFHGAHIGRDSEVRVNAVVHVRTRLEAASLVPIGWVAVGDPAAILSASDHDAIWARQEPLDFPGTVYGLAREAATVANINRVIRRGLGLADD